MVKAGEIQKTIQVHDLCNRDDYCIIDRKIFKQAHNRDACVPVS